MRIVVRPLRPGDEASLGPLHNHVWRVAYAGLMPAAYLGQRDDAAATRRWKQSIDALDGDGTDPTGCTTLVAEADGVIVGFLRVGPARDPNLTGLMELMGLYVLPKFHGRGVAQALTGRGLPDGPSYLWVLEGNHRAQAFYRKLGYHADGATKVHEPTGATEVRMTRP